MGRLDEALCVVLHQPQAQVGEGQESAEVVLRHDDRLLRHELIIRCVIERWIHDVAVHGVGREQLLRVPIGVEEAARVHHRWEEIRSVWWVGGDVPLEISVMVSAEQISRRK